MKFAYIALSFLIAVPAMPSTLRAEGLENPAPGSIRRVYALHPNNVGSDHARWHQETVEAILAGRVAPYSTAVDTSSGGFRVLNGNEIGMWTGWIQCRNAGMFTLVVNRSSRLGPGWYLCSLWVNGRAVLSAQRGATLSVNVPLQAGFNEIRLVSEGSANTDNHVELSLKRSDSIKDPAALAPGSLWHEDEVEEDGDDGDWIPATPATAAAPAPKPAPRHSSFNIGEFLPDYDPQ